MADEKIFSDDVNAARKRWVEVLKIQTVWAKGTVVPGCNPAIWRTDTYGSLMNRSEYGNCESAFGWEIDHIQPLSLNGSERFANLQPLSWKNNRAKADKVISTTGILGI